LANVISGGDTVFHPQFADEKFIEAKLITIADQLDIALERTWTRNSGWTRSRSNRQADSAGWSCVRLAGLFKILDRHYWRGGMSSLAAEQTEPRARNVTVTEESERGSR